MVRAWVFGASANRTASRKTAGNSSSGNRHDIGAIRKLTDAEFVSLIQGSLGMSRAARPRLMSRRNAC
jgi:hypothetical protein